MHNQKNINSGVRFINTYEPVSSFYRDLLPYLAEQKVRIEVLISRNKYSECRDGLEEALNHPGIQINYISVPSIFEKNGLKKIATMFSYASGVIGRSLFGSGVSLNFFLSQPPMFIIWGYFCKVLRKQAYSCLVMDLYPDVVVQHGFPPILRFIERIMTRVSRFALKHADQVIVIGRCMRDYLHRTGLKRDDIKIITNWANEQVIFPVPRSQNPLRKELGLKNDFIVLYSGNMGVAHMFADILEVARRLRDKKGIKFVFIGDGVRRKEILRVKTKYSLGNIMLLHYQPIDNLSLSISLGDIHFISLRNGFEGLVVPSKAYGVMAAGRPILYQGHKNGEIARVINEEGIGTVVEPDNPDMLEKVILYYYQNPDVSDAQGKRSYQVSKLRFSRKNALFQYHALFSNYE